MEFTHCNAADAAFWNAFNYHEQNLFISNFILSLSRARETILNCMYEKEFRVIHGALTVGEECSQKTLEKWPDGIRFHRK